MGTRAWHVARAKHHKKAADYLHGDSTFDDWACTALFYSALQYVHSSLADEPSLAKDERHPRKHTAPPGDQFGGRGVNQLVATLYGEIEISYKSLFELSRRTRYDINQLATTDATTYQLATLQWQDVKRFCEGLNQGRQTISTQAP